ncbi:RHS repeat protein [Candidatus Protofrankia californiensis]|uniref:RHS repeat protein n=1 Tax=Candidatus Protofrankia californiensis TaxID=1839754 RepID=UPI001040ECB4|nr:RHS repeat protein [Candidatus Protofrankia californiensis]
MICWADRNGTEYVYTYDDAGRMVCTAGSAGCLDGAIIYDTARYVTVETNSLGHTTEYHFNDTMQLQRQVDPLDHVTTYEWDCYARKLAETDPLGVVTSYKRDACGRVVAVTDPIGG